MLDVNARVEIGRCICGKVLGVNTRVKVVWCIEIGRCNCGKVLGVNARFKLVWCKCKLKFVDVNEGINAIDVNEVKCYTRIKWGKVLEINAELNWVDVNEGVNVLDVN